MDVPTSMNQVKVYAIERQDFDKRTPTEPFLSSFIFCERCTLARARFRMRELQKGTEKYVGGDNREYPIFLLYEARIVA